MAVPVGGLQVALEHLRFAPTLHADQSIGLVMDAVMGTTGTLATASHA
jgi:hypothetical protein